MISRIRSRRSGNRPGTRFPQTGTGSTPRRAGGVSPLILHPTTSKTKRRGVEVLEVILVLPILVIASIAILQFGLIVLTYQAVVAAVDQATREVCKDFHADTPARLITAVDVVTEYLGIHEIDVANDVRIQVDSNGTTATHNPGLPTTPLIISVPPGMARVYLSVGLLDSRVPNWLTGFGFSLTGKRFDVPALMLIE